MLNICDMFRFFTLFMNLLNDCSEESNDDSKDRPRGAISASDLSILRHATVQAMSNLLNANIESGLMHSIGQSVSRGIQGPIKWKNRTWLYITCSIWRYSCLILCIPKSGLLCIQYLFLGYSIPTSVHLDQTFCIPTAIGLSLGILPRSGLLYT